MCRLTAFVVNKGTAHLQVPGAWVQCPEWEAPAGRWEAALEVDALAEAEELEAAEAEASARQVPPPIHAPPATRRASCSALFVHFSAAVSSPAAHLPLSHTCRVGDGWI